MKYISTVFIEYVANTIALFNFRSVKLLPIERLLWIAEAYVLGVEELHQTPRSILPHGASFHGYPLSLIVRCEALHQEFTVLVRFEKTFLLCSFIDI